jgi:hypothetical protein
MLIFKYRIDLNESSARLAIVRPLSLACSKMMLIDSSEMIPIICAA